MPPEKRHRPSDPQYRKYRGKHRPKGLHRRTDGPFANRIDEENGNLLARAQNRGDRRRVPSARQWRQQQAQHRQQPQGVSDIGPECLRTGARSASTATISTVDAIKPSMSQPIMP